MEAKDKQLILDYLSGPQHILMTLATVDGDKPWVCSVYYVVDDDLNLYFISPPDAEHSTHIKDNQNVACAIADSDQTPDIKKIGLQISGTISEEKTLAKVKWMLKMYNKLHPSTKEKYNFKNFQAKAITSKVYKVTPDRIKFFNQALFKGNPEKVYTL